MNNPSYNTSNSGYSSFFEGSYRYGFQGQEHDDEIKGKGNSVNYQYRMHDPRLGRFFAVDPLANDYPFYSPYSFSGNQVIFTFELEGLEPNEEINQVNLFTANPNTVYVAPNYAANNSSIFDVFDWKLNVSDISTTWELIGEHEVEMLDEVEVSATRPVLKSGTQKMIDQAWNKGHYFKAFGYMGNAQDASLKGNKGALKVAGILDGGSEIAGYFPGIGQGVSLGLGVFSAFMKGAVEYEESEKNAGFNSKTRAFSTGINAVVSRIIDLKLKKSNKWVQSFTKGATGSGINKATEEVIDSKKTED